MLAAGGALLAVMRGVLDGEAPAICAAETLRALERASGHPVASSSVASRPASAQRVRKSAIVSSSLSE